MIAFAAAAALIPALISSGDDSPAPLQIADSAWMQPAVWSTGEPEGIVYPAGYLRDWTADLTEDGPLERELAALVEMIEESAPTPVPTPTPEPWATLEVRPGDTLFGLALWFDLKPGDIAAFNGIDPGEPIVIGETLVIPVPESQFVTPPEPVVVYADEEPASQPASDGAVAPPPVPTPTPFAGSTDEVIQAICSQPWPCETMVQVAMCESGLYPGAYNPAGYYGLFQINYAFDGWNDPWVNSRVAYEQKYLPAVQRGGTGLEPWPICGRQ